MARIVSLVITFWILCSFCPAQQKPIKSVPVPPETQPTVPTGSNQDGVKYFIKIIRSDSTRLDGMPTYQPDNTGTFTVVDLQPVPIRRVEPVSPRFNFASEVTVWVKCLVGEDGKVKKAVVMKSTDRFFERPSIDAALQWEFMPATRSGVPVAVWAAIPFRYKPRH